MSNEWLLSFLTLPSFVSNNGKPQYLYRISWPPYLLFDPYTLIIYLIHNNYGINLYYLIIHYKFHKVNTMLCITMTPHMFSSICILPPEQILYVGNLGLCYCQEFSYTFLYFTWKNSTHPHGSNSNIASFVKASLLFFHSVIWTLVSWHSSTMLFIVLQDK